MARQKPGQWAELSNYDGNPADESLGLLPLAVGWFGKEKPTPTGPTPAGFLAKLELFCAPANRLNHPRPVSCPLCKHTEAGEIRVMGDDDIFSAPALIYHLVAQHQYQPPASFIQAVLHGPDPTTAEYRALLRTLQTF